MRRRPAGPNGSLQWGRGVVAAEGADHPAESRQGERASMGPRRRRRGGGFSFYAKRWGEMLQWGRGVVAAEGVSSHAGMITQERLQWGRGVVAAEG